MNYQKIILRLPVLGLMSLVFGLVGKFYIAPDMIEKGHSGGASDVLTASDYLLKGGAAFCLFSLFLGVVFLFLTKNDE